MPFITNFVGTRRYIVPRDDFTDISSDPAGIILLNMPKNVVHVLLALGVVGPPESCRSPVSMLID